MAHFPIHGVIVCSQDDLWDCIPEQRLLFPEINAVTLLPQVLV